MNTYEGGMIRYYITDYSSGQKSNGPYCNRVTLQEQGVMYASVHNGSPEHAPAKAVNRRLR